MSKIHPNILDDIGDACSRVNLSYAIFAKNHQINANELAILYTLWTTDVATQKYIADKYHLAKQTIHTLCKKYEQDGIIQSHISQTDKREKVIALTDKGRAFASPIVEHLLNQEKQIIDEFGIERLLFLLNETNELQKLIANHLEQ